MGVLAICLLAALCAAAIALALCFKTIFSLREKIRQQADAMDMQTEKTRAAIKVKSDFLSTMSHEIRTPLNAIIGMAQIARSAETLDKRNDSMEKIESNSKHLLGIINDILDFSKLESGGIAFENQWFSLTKEIDFVTSMFKSKIAEKRIDFQIRIEDLHNDGIETDRLRLNQVLINMLSNAVKFTDDGGRIALIVEELFSAGDESVYRFAVEDSGVGIEPEQAKKLFTPFTQANAAVSRLYGGTGLGLAISQNIVQMMGGNIELDTKPGVGSIFQFTIRVPSKKAVEKETEALLVDPPPKLSGKRILVVDDIDINREIIVELLKDSGAAIETAANGREALEAFCQGEPHRYDLIFMDMQMPVMDGCAATVEIRNSGKPDAQDIKIVAMTANVMQEDIERAKNSGMDEHLAKPIDLADLYAIMEKCL